MQRLIKRIATLALATTIIAAAATAAPSISHAANYGYSHHCTYKTVTKWVSKRVPYSKRVTLYKPCGTPYYVWKTYYKTISVPVTYRVKVCCH